ncbi:MAG: hypothetical protein HY851_04240, partial [candidate division Zixibacteria bacterium]|nr:hypothetical protein [candidate division Zixibacteria bacterium]
AHWSLVKGLGNGLLTAFPRVSRSGYLFAPLWDGLYRSKDNGDSWQRVSGNFDEPRWITAIYCDNLRNVIYAADQVIDSQFFSHGNIYRSNDEGDTWTKVHHVAFTAVAPLFVDSRGTVDAGGVTAPPAVLPGLARAFDRGSTWTSVGTGLPGDVFLFWEGKPGSVFAMSADSGLYRLTLPPDTCCAGMAGNVDCDLSGSVDISDLSTLIDHLFIGLAPLCCPGEADCDGQPGVDISDLSALIDYLFVGFNPPSACR